MSAGYRWRCAAAFDDAFVTNVTTVCETVSAELDTDPVVTTGQRAHFGALPDVTVHLISDQRPSGSVVLVDVAPVINIYDRDRPGLVIDPVDDPVDDPVTAWRSGGTSAAGHPEARVVRQRPIR
ncbi:MAG TPA: hypothetical protein VIY28_02795 [Pseudonocardiaceae bacterium]